MYARRHSSILIPVYVRTHAHWQTFYIFSLQSFIVSSPLPLFFVFYCFFFSAFPSLFSPLVFLFFYHVVFLFICYLPLCFFFLIFLSAFPSCLPPCFSLLPISLFPLTPLSLFSFLTHSCIHPDLSLHKYVQASLNMTGKVLLCRKLEFVFVKAFLLLKGKHWAKQRGVFLEIELES